MKNLHEQVVAIVNGIRSRGYYPDVKVLTGVSSTPIVKIDGKEYIQFSSANYLGLTTNREIVQGIKDGLDIYGIHPSSSRLISGTQDIHVQLENRLAQFKQTEDAFVLPSGLTANLGVIPALTNMPLASLVDGFTTFLQRSKTVIFSDEFNHASVIDGIRLSKVEVEVYKHCDSNDLEQKLNRNKRSKKLIITDGVFSMNGDIAPLDKLVALAETYNAMLMVDDAHGTGILGENGRGTAEHFKINSSKIAINMGTFSKAFGVSGGFIAGEKELIDYLRIATRTYMFTGSFLGGLALGALKSIDVVEKAKDKREVLWRNSHHLRDNLQAIGFNTLGSQTPIIPILLGDEELAISYYNYLFKRGILAPCFRWPAVEKGKSIIRFSLTSEHTPKHIDQLLEVVNDIKKNSAS